MATPHHPEFQRIIDRTWTSPEQTELFVQFNEGIMENSGLNVHRIPVTEQILCLVCGEDLPVGRFLFCYGCNPNNHERDVT